MEKNILLRRSLFFLVLLFLIFPIIYLVGYVRLAPFSIETSFWRALQGGLTQSLLSTLLTLILGGLGSLGLLSVRARWPSWAVRTLTVALVLPSFTPPIIIITLAVGGLGGLYSGLWGVVFFHTLMNVGLVSVLFARVIEDKASGWLTMSLTCGVGRLRFLVKGLLPGLRSEISMFSFYLMLLYFFSFSIPLIVGGTRYGGVEVFIFEKVALFGQWSEALNYSIILFVFLLFVSLFLKRGPKNKVQSWPETADVFKFLRLGPFLSLASLPSLFLAICFVVFLLQAPYWSFDYNLWEPLRGTLALGIMTGLTLFILLSILSFSFVGGIFSHFLLALISPGWVVVGFSFLLMPGEGEITKVLKNAIALSIIFLPFLYRMAFNQKLEDLNGQVKSADVLPVSWRKTFFVVIWPQCLPSIGFLSGIGALWACGDFALSSILLDSSQISTLALDMKNLILSYRLEQAVSLLLPLMVASSIVFIVFQGIGYVCRRKILS